MAYVLYSEQEGVYLGSFLGLSIWSKAEPASPDAVAFASEAEAERFMASWECGRPDGVRVVEVEESSRGWASIANCVKAGLPGWEYVTEEGEVSAV